jgi:hypothetical protein
MTEAGVRGEGLCESRRCCDLLRRIHIQYVGTTVHAVPPAGSQAVMTQLHGIPSGPTVWLSRTMNIARKPFLEPNFFACSSALKYVTCRLLIVNLG